MKKIKRCVEQKVYECKGLRKRTHMLERSINEVKTEIDNFCKKKK